MVSGKRELSDFAMTWSGSKSDTELIIERGRAVAHYWRDLRRYSDLYGVLVWRDPSIRYKETIFGFLWALARPFLTMLALFLGFAKLAKLLLRRVLAALLDHVYGTLRELSDVICDAAMLARWRSEDFGATAGPADVAPEPVPDAAIKQRPALATAYVAPSGPEEEKLSTVWSGLLGINVH